ncbi:uncharacterized protein Z518_02603 [Rhinocladiella mackenziei CBS 650.93]|uniref:F-box domain-containing protein n=1 Tax=Rhinocladiella mackenziei CBS 650.93 TaxID=1442369 RepID=A0A0D2IPY9_9EURO|nr:uncharacterized protein Z518_02603 [Rhinocladiella mackenziei CBS 650.93]KIX07949.1 hypothetical protein Z518_02603 [Rhinocladiella mackenziei CBS 650.93]
MEDLPEEILIDILDYLDPEELISAQRTCRALSRSARANPLWRYKCFEKSPSASMRNGAGTLSTLTAALQSLTISEPPPPPQVMAGNPHGGEYLYRESPRARAVNRWDLSAKDEQVDWYSEYKGRCAPLSTDWLVDGPPSNLEVKGVATLHGSGKAVGYLEDSSVCLWDLDQGASGRRQFRELGRSQPSALFADAVQPGESLIVDGISTFPAQQKGFVAIGNVLNEVDLNILRVVSHSKYAFPITALSQSSSPELPLTVGTQWSLHILDPRIQVGPSTPSLGEHVEEVPAAPGSSTAFLPDLSGNSALLSSTFGITSQCLANPDPSIFRPGSPSWRPSHRSPNSYRMTYARVEPGPLSILHHAENEILIGGRFPSILSYDRRYFPRLQYVIHSSASLSALTSIPYPPAGASPNVRGTSTLIACGEYRGRGSLELYSLPHVKSGQRPPGGQDPANSQNPSDDDGWDIGSIRSRGRGSDDSLFSYKNRQDAAKSKLLSVVAQGTKIVFSDSEGGLKWVERDGHSLVRRWNINSYQLNQAGAAIGGDQVARKIIPLNEPDSERGHRGDADLLIWTGEKIGIVTTNPQFADHEELVRELEGGEKLKEKEEREKTEEYSKTMRRALERQADERRWMSQFRLKRRDF